MTHTSHDATDVTRSRSLERRRRRSLRLVSITEREEASHFAQHISPPRHTLAVDSCDMIDSETKEGRPIFDRRTPIQKPQNERSSSSTSTWPPPAPLPPEPTAVVRSATAAAERASTAHALRSSLLSRRTPSSQSLMVAATRASSPVKSCPAPCIIRSACTPAVRWCEW
eukprot:scaffold6088_cov128-Isochrysis_galbana.AAC.2